MISLELQAKVQAVRVFGFSCTPPLSSLLFCPLQLKPRRNTAFSTCPVSMVYAPNRQLLLRD